MGDALFPSADTLSALVSAAGQYVGAGVGIAFIGWVLGYAIFWIIDTMRY